MPWPESVEQASCTLPVRTVLRVNLVGDGAKDDRLLKAVERFRFRLVQRTGMLLSMQSVMSGPAMNLRIIVERKDHKGPQKFGDDERYSLRVTDTEAVLSADAPLGVLRGLQTLLQLVTQNAGDVVPGFSAACVSIRDGPRFGWRGLSLDVSRHFLTTSDVKRTLDGMEAVKLNVLHWHLSDDQGFRVESKRFPRLQQLGSNGQFYTQAEIREVLAYARDRGIRIVPEFDTPGHATSWMPGYPQLASRTGSFRVLDGYAEPADVMDPTKEFTYRFLDGFIGEMAKLFPDEYFHIGGDEVSPKQWEANRKILSFMRKKHLRSAAQLQSYFNRRLLVILQHRHKRVEGWDEILQPDLPKDILVQSWRGSKSLQQGAREGYSGILSAGYYLDLVHPASEHYAIDPLHDIAPEQQHFILGGEAAMWEELVSTQNIDSRLWPRLAAIAERFWSPASVTDPTSMYTRLDACSHWLEQIGLQHRSELELLRQRLAGEATTQSLDIFAETLEPVKGYSRHPQRYGTSTPLNRLVDAVPPESNAARHFRDAVAEYLKHPQDAVQRAALADQLRRWSASAQQVRPLLQSNTLLQEAVAISDDMQTLCRQGEDAIGHLQAGEHAPKATVASERHADIVIAIAPAIQDLVNAVSP